MCLPRHPAVAYLYLVRWLSGASVSMSRLSVHTITLSAMSWPCDSSAATRFMPASTAMKNWLVTCRWFGARASARPTRSSAATATRRCRLPSISIAEIVVLYVARLLTHSALNTMISILNYSSHSSHPSKRSSQRLHWAVHSMSVFR